MRTAYPILSRIAIDSVPILAGAVYHSSRTASAYHYMWRSRWYGSRSGIFQMQLLALKRHLFTLPDTTKDGDRLLQPGNARRGTRYFRSPCTRFLEVVPSPNTKLEAPCTPYSQG